MGIEDNSIMLICPQCESENPDNNKFCQQCGNSLTEKECHECGTKVDYSEENCLNCGAFTAIIRRAIVSLHSLSEDHIKDDSPQIEENHP